MSQSNFWIYSLLYFNVPHSHTLTRRPGLLFVIAKKKKRRLSSMEKPGQVQEESFSAPSNCQEQQVYSNGAAI